MIFLIALGLGSIIEICEYVVTLTIPQNGVGGYDDNLRDLAANATGGMVFLLTRGRIPRRFVHPPKPPS
jgi:hypothetical protein